MSENNYWTRLHGRSVSRRTLLRGAAVGGAGLAGAALIGCGGDDDDDVTATGTSALVTEAGVGEIDEITGVAGEEPGTYEVTGPEAWIFEEAPKNVPIAGGTYVSTYAGSDDHFSPHHLGGGSTGSLYDRPYQQFFAGDVLVLLRAVSRVERIDDLMNVMTVADARFWPNEYGIDRTVTAEDIVANMRLRVEDLTATSSAFYAGAMDWDLTAVVDDQTYRLVTLTPRNDLFTDGSSIRIVAGEHVATHLSGEKTLQEYEPPAVGSGMRYQTRFVPGSVIERTKNPFYSRAPWPYITNSKSNKVTDSAAREAQFIAGETHFFSEASIFRFDEILEDLGGGRPTVYGAKALSPAPASGIALHGNSDPWTDIRAREAFTRAIDRDKAIEVLGQGEGVKVGPGVNRFYENMHLPMDDPDLVDWLRFDPQRSRELLAAIRADGGVDVDRTLDLVISSASQAQGDRAVFLKQMLDEVGFNFEIVAIAPAQYATRAWRRATADFDLRTAGSFSRPQEQLRMFHTDSRLLSETVCMCDPELDAMIEGWEQTIDAEEVDRKARDIQRWLILHWAVAFPMYNDFLRFLYKITLRNINPDHIVPESWGWIDESYLEG